MSKRTVLAAFLALTAVVAAATNASAQGGGGFARVVSHGKERAPGVKATAVATYRPPQRTNRPQRAFTTVSGATVVQEVPAPVALSAHNCIPRTDARGVSLAYSFVESGVADCVSFVSPPPPEPANAARPDRPPRPSPEALAQRAYDRVIELAPQPDLGVAPARTGLTGLKSFFWIDNDMGPVSATAGVRGLTVTAQARPVEYTWDFGDGSTRTTQHPGRPWTKARNGNVGHLYETKGGYEPTVTALWAARWRVNGGPWRDLGYFSTEGSVDYRVRQVLALLVRRRDGSP